MKGRISKWLTEHTPGESAKHLARGYFAVTCGGRSLARSTPTWIGKANITAMRIVLDRPCSFAYVSRWERDAGD